MIGTHPHSFDYGLTTKILHGMARLALMTTLAISLDKSAIGQH
jgi:hypothetical protein